MNEHAALTSYLDKQAQHVPHTLGREEMSNEGTLRELDDLNEAIQTAARRLAEAHGELIAAGNARRNAYHGIRSGEEWEKALDHENYLIVKCAELQQRLRDAEHNRDAFLSTSELEREAPLEADA